MMQSQSRRALNDTCPRWDGLRQALPPAGHTYRLGLRNSVNPNVSSRGCGRSGTPVIAAGVEDLQRLLELFIGDAQNLK